jgi:hypothetical protein
MAEFELAPIAAGKGVAESADDGGTPAMRQ